MNNRGFTLAELLGVLVIVSLLSIVTFVAITNQISKSSNEISDTTTRLVNTALDLYIDANQTIYRRINGSVYCPTVGDIQSAGFLQEPLIDTKTNKEVAKETKIKVSFSNNKFEYIIAPQECTATN